MNPFFGSDPMASQGLEQRSAKENRAFVSFAKLSVFLCQWRCGSPLHRFRWVLGRAPKLVSKVTTIAQHLKDRSDIPERSASPWRGCPHGQAPRA